MSDYSNDTTTPLILIHGILGSKLKRKSTNKEIWPDNVRKLVFSRYKNLAFEINPETIEPYQSDYEAFEILDSITGFSVYQEIIDTLVDYGNYQLTDINEPFKPGRKLYVFNYDWRQDNVITVKQLDDFINTIQAKYSDNINTKQKVDIVAHSMGGLISRYYMRYGTSDVLNDNEFTINLDGAKNIRRAVFLGTPNLGLVLSVNRFVNGYRFGLRTIPIEVMITMPSIYQLLPHSISNWIVDLKGNKIDIDVFDQETWQKYQWAIYDPKVQQRIIENSSSRKAGLKQVETLKKFFHKNLERARRFLWSLTIKLENDNHQFVILGGDCEKTPARLVMEKIDDTYFVRTKPAQVIQKYDGIDYEKLMLEPGDGHVTKSSLLARVSLDPSLPRHKYSYFPIKYPILLCESHISLTSNITFQDNLLDILLNNDE
ncbi:MAG: hypothetical protein JKY19_07395 [Alcanivoracaceae bacterium]|nr:hypothetical protein [Alcanivoracaceae bacterium]